MKKIALHLLKSADEKLRSIGSKPQQHPPASPAAPACHQASAVMAERRVQLRHGRRDRRDGDVQSKDEVKRRSRSEGPSGRRLAQSMDVGTGNGKRSLQAQNAGSHFEKKLDSKFAPSGRNRGSSPCSDEGGFTNPGPPTSDSDSDSDRVQWTKNPLMVRKVKRNKPEKRQTSEEKNNSSCYDQLGARNTNRESWVYLAPEGDQGAVNSDQMKNEGGSNPGSLKTKYQKLEEMRKKRIDIAVTSDEETTPESRISRLRQRALQGGLGSQQKVDHSSLVVSDHNGWAPSSGPRIAHTTMSDQGSCMTRAQPSKGLGLSLNQVSSVQRYGYEPISSPSAVTPSSGSVVSQRPVSRSSVEMVSQAQPPLGDRSVGTVSYTQPPAGRTTTPVTSTQPLQQQRQLLVHQRQQSEAKQTAVKPFINIDAMASSSPPGHPQFYTIPEPQGAHRAYHSSSPEVQTRKLTSTVRVPSADSIYDSVSFSQQPETTRYGVLRTGGGTQQVFSQANPPSVDQVFAQVNPPSIDKMVVQRGTAFQNSPSDILNGNKRQTLPQFNEVVELRLKTQPRTKERPLSQGFETTKLSQIVNQQDGGFKSEDSLDELIESNIQYLEREIDRGKGRRGGASVSRSSSAPDPRRMTANLCQPSVTASLCKPSVTASICLPSVTVSGQQQSHPVHNQQQADVVTVSSRAKSELHFQIPLPSTSSQAKPHIQIAEENQLSDSAYFGPNAAYAFNNANIGDRKYSYDSRSRSQRPNSENLEKDDLSKSDTHLNAAIVAPTYRYSMQHSNYSCGRGCVSDQNLSQDRASNLSADRGMFSDVDYDIEVSERVKKWEKFMKKEPHHAGAELKKPASLTTIQERGEGDSLMMPSEVRRSVRTNQLYSEASITTSPQPQLSVVNLKPASSDPTLHMFGDQKVHSRETNTHRFFQADPRSGLELTPPDSRSASAVYIDLPQLTPHSFTQSASASHMHACGGLMSPNELRQHMLANKRQRDILTKEHRETFDSDSALDKGTDIRRVSRYQDEIDEMQIVKHESVRDLRRRFDEKSASAEDEPSGELRVAKVSPTSKDESDVNWTQMISGLEGRIKDMEVWSPNMQSTQGIVSIERVQARTLQTIPFSEDPFWKEIEEMTMFDPNSLRNTAVVAGHIQGETKRAMLDAPSSQSSTLPNQPRQHSGVSMRDRLHRSKSLYTPNITPLTISVDSYSSGKSSSLERNSNIDKYSAPSALDDVLEDIRSSLERKPLSPKKKAGDSSDSHRSSPGPYLTSELIKSRSDRSRGPITAEVVQISKWDDGGATSRSHRAEPVSVTISSTQRPQPPAGGMVAGHYHLDPLLLRQKLLSTGLVEEEKADEVLRRHVVPTTTTPLTAPKPVAVAPPQTIARPAVFTTVHPPSCPQQDKLSQVNDSMEELRQLAINVEQKINVIKSLLHTADDQNLDKILVALRKFAPSTGPHSPEIRPRNMQDFYVTKKSKLEDALSELERIYDNLNLKDDMAIEKPERMEYPLHRSSCANPKSSVSSSSNMTSSHNLTWTKPSSAYVSPMPMSTMQAQTSIHQTSDQRFTGETEKQTQSEFDLISKSFQAIIDEVNKTASLVSNASSPHPQTRQPLHQVVELHSKVCQREPDFLAKIASPEIQRRTFNIALKAQEVRSPPAVAPKPAVAGSTSTNPSYKQLPASTFTQSPFSKESLQTCVTGTAAAPADKPETRTRSRFRVKGNEEDDVSAKRLRSKSSPTITVNDLVSAACPGGDHMSLDTAATAHVSFQVTPAVSSRLTADNDGLVRNPPSHTDIAHARMSPVGDLQLKPPNVSEGDDVFLDQPVSVTTANEAHVSQHPFVVKLNPKPAPPLDTKTVVFPGATDSPQNTAGTSATEAKTSVSVFLNRNAGAYKNDASSSESSTDNKGARMKRMGRGVAMMVELFSSSDEERLRKTQPLHTRSAPDLSSDVLSDDMATPSRNITSMRPAEVSKAMQLKNSPKLQEVNASPKKQQLSKQQVTASSVSKAQNDEQAQAMLNAQSASVKAPSSPVTSVKSLKPVSNPVTSASSVKTPSSPVTSAPSVKTPSSPVTSVKSVKVLSNPVTNAPSAKTPSNPVTNVPSAKTPSTPVTNATSLKTPSTLVTSVKSVKALSNPVTNAPTVKTPSTPVTSIKSVKAPSSPVTSVKSVKTLSNPVTNSPSVKTTSSPVTSVKSAKALSNVPSPSVKATSSTVTSVKSVKATNNPVTSVKSVKATNNPVTSVKSAKGPSNPVTIVRTEKQITANFQSPTAKPPVHPVKHCETNPESSSGVVPTETQPTPTVLPDTASVATTTVASPEVSLTSDPVIMRGKLATAEDGAKASAMAVPSDRPHSFHETLAFFQPSCQRLAKFCRLRKYASEEAVVIGTVGTGTFRLPPFASEPDLPASLVNAPTLEEVRQWKR